ncbi:hypothetical protein [Sphingomonas sp. KC8]|uniref:hypothetical protein n=1 Tax=Sphingomonas sp. KC8 TaxID=1030157 RepID=UPI000683754B|nr:hypothetical protein [Sphingomonas sp. KC8]
MFSQRPAGMDLKDMIPQGSDIGNAKHPAERVERGIIPSVERLIGVFDPRQDYRRDAIIALQGRDRQGCVHIAPDT